MDVGRNTIKEFTMDKTWAQLADPGYEWSEGKSCLKRNLFQETPIRIAISSRRTNRQRKAPHANRTSEDTAFQDVNLEIRMFSCQNVLETAPWESAKVGENRKGRDVRS